mgnify:FL=1
MRPKGFFGILIISQILGRCKHHVISIKVHWGVCGGKQAPMSRQIEAYTRAEEGFASSAMGERKKNASGQVET